MRPLAAWATVRAPRHHRALAGLPAAPVARRLSPVDLLRPALCPAPVVPCRSEDPRRDRPDPGRALAGPALVDRLAPRPRGAPLIIAPPPIDPGAGEVC